MRHLALDGYLNGTGIRDMLNSGYIDHDELNISPTLSKDIKLWLNHYWSEFYTQYSDIDNIAKLDEGGMELVMRLRRELPNDKIEYFSDAKMVYLK